jgi:hypothetical protein
MHAEPYTISPAAADALNRAKSEGRRVIAVGTTSARVLESQPAGEPIRPTTDQTQIFIYPPYTWRHVDALITNFHLPRSTLIALVAALVGLDEQRRLYQTAIDEKYRFFSYGDAMFRGVTPRATRRKMRNTEISLESIRPARRVHIQVRHRGASDGPGNARTRFPSGDVSNPSTDSAGPSRTPCWSAPAPPRAQVAQPSPRRFAFA